MEGEGEDGVPRLSKRFGDKEGEVDFKTKSGTAWSHSFLNQKPWHPLSYPNQRRKWIAEQTHAHRQRRAEDVAREYAQEQDFLRQTSLLSQKEKEKVDMMQAVSFMYIRPPGYNAESAKAAEIVDEKRKLGVSDSTAATSSSVPQEAILVKDEKKKARPKDVFGRTLPTEEEFAVLKNAPRLETGVAGRAKPFAVEVRNVKCVRCGTFGHQSGDRECPLKDAIMPNEESRLKRDDPLTAIVAHMDPSEPLKWELKQKPGISPPRGGFQPDDPNQQIVAEEIFDEYGGFLSGGVIPELLTSFSSRKHTTKKSKNKSKHKKHRSSKRNDDDTNSDSADQRSSIPRVKSKYKKHRSSKRSDDDTSSDSDDQRSSAPRSKSKNRKHRSSKRSDDDTSSDTDDRRSSAPRSKSKNREHKSSKRSRGTNSDSDDQRSLIPRSKSKHKKHKSSKRSDDDTYFDSDNQRSLRPRSKSKQRKQPSSKQSRADDSHTSASDSGDNVRTRISVSRHKYGKQVHDKYGGEFSDGASDDSENRRSRKEHNHKSKKSKRYASHSSVSNESDNEMSYSESRHNRSHQAGHLDSEYRNSQSSRCRESRNPYVDKHSDGERKSSRKD